MIERIKLRAKTQDAIIQNRASGKPAADRTGFVGVVQFSGPRGGNFRPTFIAVRLTLDEALADIETIKSRTYRQTVIAISEDVIEIDATGRRVS